MGMWSRRSPSTNVPGMADGYFRLPEKKEELPRRRAEYIAFIEAVGVKIKYVSVGAERDQYIVL